MNLRHLGRLSDNDTQNTEECMLALFSFYPLEKEMQALIQKEIKFPFKKKLSLKFKKTPIKKHGQKLHEKIKPCLKLKTFLKCATVFK